MPIGQPLRGDEPCPGTSDPDSETVGRRAAHFESVLTRWRKVAFCGRSLRRTMVLLQKHMCVPVTSWKTVN